MSSDPYSGRLIARLRRETTMSIRRRLLGVSDQNAGAAWRSEIAQELGSVLHPLSRSAAGALVWGPLVRNREAAPDQWVPPAALLRQSPIWTRRPRGPSRPRSDLLDGYLVLKTRAAEIRPDRARAALESLSAHPGIEAAYREPRLREPCWKVKWQNDPKREQQVYLEGDGKGVNARNRRVWGRYNGSHVKFVDIERGWAEHEDLPSPCVHGHNHNDGKIHGAKTLGVIAACDNDIGIVGLAPGATCAGLVSRVAVGDDGTKCEWELADAIYQAAELLDPGDVVLLEVETVDASSGELGSEVPPGLLSGLPVEIVDHWFDAIRYAVEERGVVVVEPAGNGSDNGSVDLDKLRELYRKSIPGIRFTLERDSPESDSGAVLVSGCKRKCVDGQHEHMEGLNFGARVDCYGWGEEVFTTSGYTVDTSSGYEHFAHTSAASALIAGVVVLIQDMAHVLLGEPLKPVELRSLLLDPALGTAVVRQDGEGIVHPAGVLPDLAKIEKRLVQMCRGGGGLRGTLRCCLLRARRTLQF